MGRLSLLEVEDLRAEWVDQYVIWADGGEYL
jgi:hypothetical protein